MSVTYLIGLLPVIIQYVSTALFESVIGRTLPTLVLVVIQVTKWFIVFCPYTRDVNAMPVLMYITLSPRLPIKQLELDLVDISACM